MKLKRSLLRIVLFGYARCHGAIAIGHVSGLLSGGQTTHAAQRTAKSTLTYELGTREFPLLLFCFFIPTWKRKKNERIVRSLLPAFRDLFCAFSPFLPRVFLKTISLPLAFRKCNFFFFFLSNIVLVLLFFSFLSSQRKKQFMASFNLNWRFSRRLKVNRLILSIIRLEIYFAVYIFQLLLTSVRNILFLLKKNLYISSW